MTATPGWDVIVVGAGHNGLTAGALLARAGLATLVVEAREVAGGCCVTEEIAPGCRASTTSYIASMLRPEVIRALDLGRHGLRMVACEPALQVALDDGEVLADWNDPARTAAGIARYSPADARAFASVHAELAQLAARLQPLFMELPPDTRATGVRRLTEAVRMGRHLRGLRGTDVEGLTQMLTGSLGQFIDARFESRPAKALLLANNLYGKHGGPYQPGTLIGLAFHLLTGGEDAVPGFFGHVMGGMGAISDAIAAAGQAHGMQIRTGAPVARIRVTGGRADGVTLASGEELTARVVLSGADPKRTFLHLVDQGDLPADFRAAVAGITMDGPCAKVNLVLEAEPQVRGMPADAPPGQRALFTLPPDLAVADACYDRAKRGELADAEQLFVDCVVASTVDPSLAPEGLAHHDVLRPVRALPAGRGDLGHPAGRARRPGPGPDRAVRAGRARDGAGPAGAHPAGPGARLRADRGQHLPRRHRARPAVPHAAGAGLGPVRHPGPGPVPVRCGGPPRRRRDRGARLQRGPSRAGRPAPGPEVRAEARRVTRQRRRNVPGNRWAGTS